MRTRCTWLFLAAATAGAPAAQARTRPYAGVTVEALYDSNVLNSMGQDGVGRVAPRLGLILDNPRGRLEAEYRLALHGYAQGKSEDTINHRAALDTRYTMTRRLDAAGDATLLIADDPVLLDRPGVAVPQGGVVDFTLRGGAEVRASRRTLLDAAYAFRITRFDLAGDGTGLAFDGDEHRVDAGVSYRGTRRLDLRLRGRGQYFISHPAGATLHQQAIGAAAGATWRATRLWRLGLDAGPMWMPDQTLSLYGNAALVRRGRRGRLALLASRELYGGTGASQAIWSSSARLDVAWLFARRLAFRARAGGYFSSPLNGELAGAGDVSGLVGRAELGWLSRGGGWRVDVYAEHRMQDASGGIAFDDINRTLAGVRLSVLTGVDFLSIEEW